jgi:hypothetical protein
MQCMGRSGWSHVYCSVDRSLSRTTSEGKSACGDFEEVGICNRQPGPAMRDEPPADTALGPLKDRRATVYFWCLTAKDSLTGVRSQKAIAEFFFEPQSQQYPLDPWV